MQMNETQVAHFADSRNASHLSGILRGIEKESLRVSQKGLISQKPHPLALGSTLTHGFITTDYSEALMEFITPAYENPGKPYAMLRDIHAFVYQHLEDETLWPASMPCAMKDEAFIPIARYGSSHNGRMKEIYRIGLGHRYGRFMQTIAGVHYNFSLPESFWREHQVLNGREGEDLQTYISEKYMGMIRNFLRTNWIIPYLFGASPAICESYLRGKKSHLDQLVPGTVYGRYATSLRMGDLGYSNNAQAHLNISYNDLTGYIDGLEHAISTPEPLYEKIGVKVDGEYRQLNSNLLQIENEYYSTIRPKRVAYPGERPSKALRRGGVQYIEVRALDLNIYEPLGISQDQGAFIDCLLLHNLFCESPMITAREDSENAENKRRVVDFGRHPDLRLIHDNREISLKRWAHQLFNEMKPIAQLLDAAQATDRHSRVLNEYICWVESPEDTLSGRIVNDVRERGDGFFYFARDHALSHADYFKQHQLAADVQKEFEDEARLSIAKQLELEQQSDQTFEEFLADYYR
jgi:glutamate--cysteine ligase